MEKVALITGLALLQFIYFGFRVGMARGKYRIKAPETTGHDVFERIYRVHYNTMEQLIVFLPALWGFAWYIDVDWAFWSGLVFVVARGYYAFSYTRNPDSRGPAVMVSSLVMWGLLIGALYGAASRYLQSIA